MAEKIRFTPEELAELIDGGHMGFTSADLAKLDRADQAVAVKLFRDRGISPEPNKLEAPILFGPGGAAGAAAGVGEMLPGAARMAGKVIPPALKAGAYAIGAKMGHPFAIGAAGGWLANQARRILGGLGEEEALAANVAKRAVKEPASPPALFNGTLNDLPSRVMETGATPNGFSMSIPKAAEGLKRERPILGSQSLDSEIAERVKGGVQNNFKGRVSIQKPQYEGAYPSNVTTESGLDELIEKILRESSEGSPSPLHYHPSAPQGMRSSVDKLKRTVARRKPK